VTIVKLRTPLASRRTPIFPKPGQGHDAAARQRNRIGLFSAALGLLPIEIIDRHQAAPLLERLAEVRPGVDAFGLGVEVGEADP